MGDGANDFLRDDSRGLKINASYFDVITRYQDFHRGYLRLRVLEGSYTWLWENSNYIGRLSKEWIPQFTSSALSVTSGMQDVSCLQ